MRQVLLYLALYLLGVAVCLAIGPRRRPALCCALGLPIGLAVLIPPVLLLAIAGVPYRRPLVVGVALALAGIVAWAIRRRGALDRGSRRVLCLGTLGFAAVAISLSAISFAAFTYDSHDIVINARVLVDDRGFGGGLLNEMGDRGPFLLVAHSLAPLIRVDHLYGLAPLLGLSFIAVFAILSWHGFGRLGVTPRQRPRLIALVSGVLFTVYLVQFHFVYIHENMPSAIYLFIFAGLFWLAEIDDDRDGVPIACIALLAFSLQRIENPAAAALFGALALLPSRLPVRSLLPWLTLYLVVLVGWSLALMARLPTEVRMSLSRPTLAVFIAITTLLYGGWLVAQLPRLSRVRRHAPVAMAVVMLVALLVSFATNADDMVASTLAMLTNLTSFEEWGVAWIGAVLLSVVGRLAVTPPATQLFTWGVGLYLGFILLLTYPHGGPYVTATTDSGMRMALQVLPLLFFYVGLQLALLQATASPDATALAAARDTSPPASA